MDDVREWLEQHGLGKYVEVFVENAIGPDVLPHLTDEHLKELGVALGDRVRLLRAIEPLQEGSPAATPVSRAPETGDIAAARIDGAERRQLTVMFCDLLDSTALSRRLDPEDLRDLNLAYQEAARAAIERYDGFVARYMGDGVLAYFGYPQAHEDDAERAVRAGMGVVDAVAALNANLERVHGIALAVRVGISTGLVVVGDLIGEGASQESAVVGETPNLAAKLQAMAEPNTVVVAPSTRRLTAGHFEYRDIGERNVKGLPDPVRVSQVLGEGRAESRFEAVRGRHLVPLVGREEETALLLRRWESAKAGEGQVVLVSGEPGIGKSRLAEEFRSRIADEPHVRLRYQCSPHHSHSALYPIITRLEHAAGISSGLDAEERLRKLAALLGQTGGALEGDLPLIADLLSIPMDGEDAGIEPDAKRRREETLRALVRQLEGLAREEPVLCVFEDVHWIDPSTRELLDRLVERTEFLPVLMIITFRPEFAPSWTGGPHVTLVALSRMSRRLSQQLVLQLAGAMAIPPTVVEEVVARTDGVPLFVEELTRAVIESEQHAGRSAGDRSGPDWRPSIPATLQDSLMSRLDQLTYGKLLAQTGSAIGREFDHDILLAVCDISASELDEGLNELVDAGLVFRRGSGPGAVYTFKHALVQDAAYESMLRETRRDLHERVARAMEAHRPGIADSEPELLAHHFAEAGLAEPAITYWCRAAERASERSANVETFAHVENALSLLQRLPESNDRDAVELRLLVTLGPALMNIRGSASPDVEKTYQRARELSETVGEPEQRFVASWGLWINQQMGGRFEAAQRTADEVLALGRVLPDSTYLLQAHHAAWTTFSYLGQNRKALEHAEQGLSLYDMERHRRSAYLYGDHDAGVCAYIHNAVTRLRTGYPDRAVVDADSALTLGHTLDHPLSLALAQIHAAMVHQLRGDPEAVLRLAQDAQRMSSKHGLEIWSNNARIMLGWASAKLGDSQGIDTMRRAVEIRTASDSKLRQLYYLAIFAELLGDAGKLEEALAVADQAQAMLDQSGEYRWAPLACRVHADLLARHGDEAGAAAQYARAMDMARQQEERYFELQAAVGHARLWRDRGKCDDARALVQPIYESFTEGFETTNLREANALLRELT